MLISLRTAWKPANVEYSSGSLLAVGVTDFLKYQTVLSLGKSIIGDKCFTITILMFFDI
jgi:hypothetical protein